MKTTGRLVITGSSSGIGRNLAQHFAANGWSVWGLARHPQVDLSGGEFRHSICDVANWAVVKAQADEIAASWGALDALICCAGVQGAVGPAMTLAPEAWSQTVRMNLEGAFNSVAAFFPLLERASCRAKVLCMSGGGAATPRPNFSAYGVAKAGIVRLVETLAHEWQLLPIDINAVAPGTLPTRLTDEVLTLGPEQTGATEYAAAQRTAAQGEASFAKITGLADWLLSAHSDGISGRLLSAPWDPWKTLADHRDELAGSDIYTLRRIVPEDRDAAWS